MYGLGLTSFLVGVELCIAKRVDGMAWVDGGGLRLGIGMGGLSGSCSMLLDTAGLALSTSMASERDIIRDGVRLRGESVADFGPVVMISLDNSSRNLEPCRFGVDTCRDGMASAQLALESETAWASRSAGDEGYCC